MITEQDIERAINDRFAIREYLESLDPATEIPVEDGGECVYHRFLRGNFPEITGLRVGWDLIEVTTAESTFPIWCHDRFPAYVQRAWSMKARRRLVTDAHGRFLLTAEACIAVLDGMED